LDTGRPKKREGNKSTLPSQITSPLIQNGVGGAKEQEKTERGVREEISDGGSVTGGSLFYLNGKREGLRYASMRIDRYQKKKASFSGGNARQGRKGTLRPDQSKNKEKWHHPWVEREGSGETWGKRLAKRYPASKGPDGVC